MGKQWKQCQTLFFGAPKSLQMVTAAVKLKDAYSWTGRYPGGGNGNHLILCHPLLLLPSIFPSIRVFSNESALHIRWPKYASFVCGFTSLSVLCLGCMLCSCSLCILIVEYYSNVARAQNIF